MSASRSPRGQGGAALLVMLALFVVVASSVLIGRLSSAARDRTADGRETARALAEAKAGLIGFAVAYADNYPGEGPGFLPCPDSDGNGSPNPPCGPSAIGRLPEEFLGLGRLRDAAGARLWYALSDNFRNNPKITPLNSQIPGQLAVDGAGDVVAVLIAPGAPLDGQDRIANPTSIGAYLEGDNATSGDGSYASGAPSATFNDTVVALTRAELMAAVERRVLAEAASSLRAYREASWNDKRVFPWLTPYADPNRSGTTFKGSVGTRAGHLAFHYPYEQFSTRVKADWDVGGAIVQIRAPPGYPSSVAARDLEEGELTVSDGQCGWLLDPQVFDCTVLRARSGDCRGQGGISIQRSYHFQYSGEYKVKRPKDDKLRRRSAEIDRDPFPAGTDLVIAITDIATSGPDAGSACGSGTLIGDADTGGKFKLKDITYHLGVPGELPIWLVLNRWHELIYVAEADKASPNGENRACAAGSSCLVLAGVSPGDDVEALLVIAGPALPGQNRTGGAIGSYFELDNKDGDDAFTRLGAAGDRPPFATDLNDQVRVVSALGP